MYLVDTSVIAEARRGSPQATQWLRSVNPQGVFLSALSLGEIRQAIARQQPADGKAASLLAEWLRRLRHDHGDRILPVDDRVAVEWGRISALRPRGDIDGLMAATAIVHDLILVTRDRADFEDTGASVLSPWDMEP